MNPFKGHPTTQQIDTPLKDVRKRLPLRVLSPADWTHWTTFGYVVVPAAVPEANIRRLVDLPVGILRDDPERFPHVVEETASRP